jgi:hypothetical protein
MLFTVFINIKNMPGVCQDKSFHFLLIKIKYDLYYNVTVLLLGGKGALDEPWRLFAFFFWGAASCRDNRSHRRIATESCFEELITTAKMWDIP